MNQSLIGELEAAIQSGSKDKRVDTLRRITDLFVADADRFNDQQIGVFDDVLGHLIKRIEGRALAELSERLAPISNAPRRRRTASRQGRRHYGRRADIDAIAPPHRQ